MEQDKTEHHRLNKLITIQSKRIDELEDKLEEHHQAIYLLLRGTGDARDLPEQASRIQEGDSK